MLQSEEWSCPGSVETSPFGEEEVSMPKHPAYPAAFREQLVA